MSQGIPDLQYDIIRNLVKLGSRVGYRLQIDGLENIYSHMDELQNGAIFAGNHESVIDAFLMGLVLPQDLREKRIYFLGKKSALWRNRFWGRMMDYFGVIPVNQRGNQEAIQKGLDVLFRKQALGIFPEGHIRYSRKDLEGKVGVARFAFQTSTPVIPVGIIGTDGVLPYGGNWPSIGKKVTLSVGEPIFFETYESRDIYDPYALRSATDLIMKEIRRQSCGYGIKPYDAHKLRCMEDMKQVMTPKGLIPKQQKKKTGIVNSFEEWLNSIPSTQSKRSGINDYEKSSLPPPVKPSPKVASQEFLRWLDDQL